jgi:hypothetical protein
VVSTRGAGNGSQLEGLAKEARDLVEGVEAELWSRQAMSRKMVGRDSRRAYVLVNCLLRLA